MLKDQIAEKRKPVKIAVGSDHAGFALKQEVALHLSRTGHTVIDLGAYNAEPSDYPDFAELVGGQLMTGAADRGILICGSGVGVCVAVNKMPGIRAAVCHDTYSGHQGVEHDDMNVLVMGSRVIGPALAREITDAYLGANLDISQERFVRRLNKVKAIERRFMLSRAK